MSSTCSPRRDFVRHIANRVIAESSGRIPVNIVEELKARLARAEDKFKFSIFNGDPSRIADFLSSEEWADLVEYARNLHAAWVLEAVLKELSEAYKEECPSVAEKAMEAVGALSKHKAEIVGELTLDSVARKLRFYGYRVEVGEEDGREYIEFEEPLVKVRIHVSEGKISYTICREGKASTVDALIAVMQKIREL